MRIEFGLDVFQPNIIQFVFDDLVIVFEDFVFGVNGSIPSIKEKAEYDQKKNGENSSE